jgi:hypothetical protein
MRSYVPKRGGGDDAFDQITRSSVFIEHAVFLRSEWDFRRDDGSVRNLLAYFLIQDGRIVRVMGLGTGFWVEA